MKRSGQQTRQKAEDFLSPASFIHAAKAAHPAFRYALAVAGILAIVTSFIEFGTQPATLVFGAIAVIGLMVLFLLFAQISKLAKSSLDLPAQVLAWAFLVIAIAIVILLSSSVFFNVPVPFRDALTQQLAKNTAPHPFVEKQQLGFKLTDAELFGTRWDAETKPQDPKFSKFAEHGKFSFFKEDRCLLGCEKVDLELITTEGVKETRSSCDFSAKNDRVHVECPNIGILVQLTFDLNWSDDHLSGTKKAVCGEGLFPSCPATGFVLYDVRLTRR